MKPAIAGEALGGPDIFSLLTGLRPVDIDWRRALQTGADEG